MVGLVGWVVFSFFWWGMRVSLSNGEDDDDDDDDGLMGFYLFSVFLSIAFTNPFCSSISPSLATGRPSTLAPTSFSRDPSVSAFFHHNISQLLLPVSCLDLAVAVPPKSPASS